MFTGIIQHIGVVEGNENGRLAISCSNILGELTVGESIAINGVCLTLEKAHVKQRMTLFFGVGPETQKITTIGSLTLAQRVHVERALSLSALIGGHMVQGHVDGVGIIDGLKSDNESLFVRIACPSTLTQFCVEKGSITVDGVSLTINTLNENFFEVCLIPHSLANTNLKNAQLGDRVNIECDMVGKYIHKFVHAMKMRS